MNRNDETLHGLRALGFSTQEAAIYIELLKKPATHAQLSQATGINRTTMYRMVNALEKQGLIVRRTDDRGKHLVAADPSTLEGDVITKEQEAKRQRAVLNRLVPKLEAMQKSYEADFSVNTYEGIEGFKRMLWHELKTKDELLCISLTLEAMGIDHRWAEKHRQKTVEAGYRVRVLCNPDARQSNFTQNSEFKSRHYTGRAISSDILPITHIFAVFNDTVAIYHIHQERRVGLEIISKGYAQTMRSNFEILWKLAS